MVYEKGVASLTDTVALPVRLNIYSPPPPPPRLKKEGHIALHISVGQYVSIP